jgi:hypothetical protein
MQFSKKCFLFEKITSILSRYHVIFLSTNQFRHSFWKRRSDNFLLEKTKGGGGGGGVSGGEPLNSPCS